MRALMTLALVFCVSTIGLGQHQFIDNISPINCCGPNYTFGAAKNHVHGQLNTYYGFYEHNGLVLGDPENNTGNFFFGNTLWVRQWTFSKVFWYDWSAQLDAPVRLAVWKSGPFADALTIRYDPECLMIVNITSPQFP